MNQREYSQKIFEFAEKNGLEWINEKIESKVTLAKFHIDFAEQMYEYEKSEFKIKKGGRYIGKHELEIGDQVTFEISPPRSRNNVFYAKNLKDLLKYKFSIINKPSDIVIHDQKFFSWDITEKGTSNIPVNILAYYRVCNFVESLIDDGIFKNTYNDEMLLFSGDGMIDLTARINATALRHEANKKIEAIDRIMEIIETDIYKDDKKRILKAVFFSYLKPRKKYLRFWGLLDAIEEISKTFSNNYELFVSEFSFDSEQENLMMQRRDYCNRLSSILSGIQSKILAIPLSLILAFGQMKTDSTDNPLFVNSGVLIAALVFSTLMWILLLSQEQVLIALHEEITSKANRFKREIPKLFPLVENTFAVLEKQYNSTKNMVIFLKALIIIGFGATIVSYAYLTPNINEIINFPN